MKVPGDIILEEIQEKGVISFARFMALALYCPETGYYEANKDNLGRSGDFITSVSAGELFGQLLAFQFAEWLDALAADGGRRAPHTLAEAGAHDGRLAADILAWLQAHRPRLFAGLEYIILEPSPRRRAWQRDTLRAFDGKIHWVAQLADLNRERPFTGILFGNELLDAFPIHRHGWDAQAQQWFEWGVTFADGKFCWSRMTEAPDPKPPSSLLHPPSSLLPHLPDGYIMETSPAAERWWQQAAETLTAGKLLAIDYGFTAEEQFAPERRNGTLRAYRGHRVSHDVLAGPGEQDLTAHVNFSALQALGETAGLRTETFCRQPQFLTRLAEKIFRNPAAFGDWSRRQTRQFQTLTHPEHLGRAFRVLVQSRR